MKVNKREAILFLIIVPFFVWLYISLLVPKNITEELNQISPSPGCPQEEVHKLFGKPIDSGFNLDYETLPYILRVEKFKIRPLDKSKLAFINVNFIDGRAYNSSLLLDFPEGHIPYGLGWYKQKRAEVRRADLASKIIKENMRHFGETLMKIQGANFKKPVIGGAIELPVLNGHSLSQLPPIRLHLYFDKKEKVFAENIELKSLDDFKVLLNNFRIRAGSSGVIILFADKSIPFNLEYIKAISDSGLYTRGVGVLESEKLLAYKNLYEIEGPPFPNEEKIKEFILNINESTITFDNKKISLPSLTDYIVKNGNFRLKMTTQKGISWQRVMDIYNEFPSDVFIVY